MRRAAPLQLHTAYQSCNADWIVRFVTYLEVVNMNSEAGTRTLCLIVTVLSPSDFALELLSTTCLCLRGARSRQLDVDAPHYSSLDAY